MNIPDIKTSLRLLRTSSTPIHIVRHCVKVARVSCFLGERLIDNGIELKVDLLAAGALLHDISKYQSINHGGDHAKLGAELLRGLGYPEVAQIVEFHVYLDKSNLSLGKITEEIVVNYSDKRVKHTEVVSLKERFEDLYHRYGKTSNARKRIDELFEQSKEMERLIFSQMGIDPNDLNRIFRRKTDG